VSKRDYYDILAVDRKASADEIKKSFRKLALKCQPDKNPGDKKAEERFKEASEAYEGLGDPEKRKAYDQFGHAGAQAQGFSYQGAQGNPFAGGYGGFSSHAGPDFMRDIFSDLFGYSYAGRGGAEDFRTDFRHRTSRGADLRYSLRVSFEESFSGTQKVITFMRMRNGKEEAARLAVTVPAGVKNGQRLKLRGEGDMPPSGTAGDLYVIVQVEDHPLFKRQENNVLMDLPVSFVDASLGTEMEIPTLTGKVRLKIPPGTPGEKILRLKNKGFAAIDGFGTGDMLVKVVIDIPTGLTEKQKQILSEFSELANQFPLVREFQDKVKRLLATRKA